MRFSIFKQKSAVEHQIERLTPPDNIDWNWSRSQRRRHAKGFSERFVKFIFPYVLRNAVDHGIAPAEMVLLDLGCGWAPMAIPFVINGTVHGWNRGDQVRYLGIDIREDAVEWLTRTYADYPYVRFHHHRVRNGADYVNAVQLHTETDAASDGAESDYAIDPGFVHNVQWSSSVFTHLTPQASSRALKFIRGCAAKTSLQVNTWLIIDDESKYALAAEIADRKLPYDFGDYLTYTKQNPLVCTAYKLEAIKRMYDEAGLEIVRIDRGAWRGPAYRNDADHYQDIVVSRPVAR
jgi:hypothetical protein